MPPKKKLNLDLKEGTFTRQSKSAGYKSVQKYADDIMKASKQGKTKLKGKTITPLLKKRANFVVVSRKWKK